MARVSVTYENHIAYVRLTRGDKMNAVDPDMITAVIAAGQEVAASDARAVVLSGEGRAFCAGIDITGMAGLMGKCNWRWARTSASQHPTPNSR